MKTPHHNSSKKAHLPLLQELGYNCHCHILWKSDHNVHTIYGEEIVLSFFEDICTLHLHRTVEKIRMKRKTYFTWNNMYAGMERAQYLLQQRALEELKILVRVLAVMPKPWPRAKASDTPSMLTAIAKLLQILAAWISENHFNVLNIKKLLLSISFSQINHDLRKNLF